MSNLGVATVGFTVTGMSLPLMFFLQLARGLTPTQSALLLIPQAVLAGILSPLAGRLLDRRDPRLLLVPGLGTVATALVVYAALMSPQTPVWMFLIPSALMGVGNAGMWGPLATTAFMQNRLAAHLPWVSDAAGFGQGVLPPAVAEGFAAAMAQAMLLPNAAILLGVAVVSFMQRPAHLR